MRKKCHRSLTARGYALAACIGIGTAAPSCWRDVGRTAFVHPAVRTTSTKPHRSIGPLMQGANEDEAIDPSDLYNDSVYLPPQPSSSWDVADDWSSLSSTNAAASTSASSTSSSNSNFDVMEEAARMLEEQERILSEWDSADDSAALGGSANTFDYVKSSEDDFVENAIEMISSNSDYHEPGGVQLYDTVSSVSSSTKGELRSKTKQDDRNHEDEEIAYMIRCNQSPEQLLISQGRALPELTEEIKYSAKFLLEEHVPASDESNSEESHLLPLQPKATFFFEKSVKKIFDAYSVPVEVDNQTHISVLDREAISKWMTKCISTSPFTSAKKPVNNGISTKKYSIGPYDQSVSAILSRYSYNHGSGRLTLEEFQALYLEVAWSGYIRDLVKKKAVFDHDGAGERHYKIPSIASGVLIEGRKNTEKMLKQASLSLVWRDLEAHEIFSPAEEERVQLLLEMEQLEATAKAKHGGGKHSQLLMDECLLFEEYEDRLSHQTYSDENDNDMLGVERGWDFLENRKEKGSHELVEMAFDGKTPKRIRDGQFVFIDEESCIGCTQCAQIAPSAFKMIEETGRARTFYQKNSLDIENAVMACPVNCMHFMSFDELKEMETSRDDGDGRSDHRHFGGRRTHTPLHVGGIDSDANHKSSWYHYLKGKCHGSASCPQRGCYDCPRYAPGENPFSKERHNQAEHVRAIDFMESGEADKWRKVVEL